MVTGWRAGALEEEEVVCGESSSGAGSWDGLGIWFIVGSEEGLARGFALMAGAVLAAEGGGRSRGARRDGFGSGGGLGSRLGIMGELVDLQSKEGRVGKELEDFWCCFAQE